MVIGTAALVLGGLAVAGSAASAISSASAANKASKVSQQANDQNAAVARETRDQNSATLAPFVAQGGAATGYINQLLGIKTAPQQLPNGDFGGYGGYPGVPGTYSQFRIPGGDFSYNGIGADPNIGTRYTPGTPATGGQPTGAAPLAPGAANDAFDAYRNSTGYQFRLGEGNRAITNNKAVSGLLNSGSALKDLTRFGQDYGSGEFSNYLGQLTGQQGVGVSAASAQAGVANNYSANITNSNNTNATNQGNAAIAKANGISGAIGGALNAGAYIYGNRK